MINAHQIKKDICEIGQRIYNKGFAAANDGNITQAGRYLVHRYDWQTDFWAQKTQ
jgi:hypothetical protein